MFTLMKDVFIGLLFITVYVMLMIPYKMFDLYMWIKQKRNKREKL
jgi:hypothetical protein